MLKRIYFFSLLSIIVIPGFFSLNIFSQGRITKIKECKVEHKTSVKYKLISAGRTIREPIITGLRIVVNGKHFNKDEMVQLATFIKAKYCDEQVISVVIFDDAKVAKEARAVIDQLAGNRKVPEIRGYYSIDRNTGEEEISFSTKRGNRPDEISLKLGL